MKSTSLFEKKGVLSEAMEVKGGRKRDGTSGFAVLELQIECGS